MIRISKQNGIMKYETYGSYEKRDISTAWCIQEADKIYRWKDFEHIYINLDDVCDDVNIYSYCKDNSLSKIVPDFTFHCWKEVGINDFDETISEIESVFENQKTKPPHFIGWIGNIDTGKVGVRRKMYEIGSMYPDLFHIISMNWLGKKDDSQQLSSTTYMSLADLVRNHSVLIDVEGNGWSARMKFLLASRRPLLFIERPYTEYAIEHFKPWVHYIPVKRDLSDLVKKALWVFHNYDEAMKIAHNAYLFRKQYFTREACFAKWNEIIHQHQSSNFDS